MGSEGGGGGVIAGRILASRLVDVALKGRAVSHSWVPAVAAFWH